jgi:DNA recombination protein RmuC
MGCMSILIVIVAVIVGLAAGGVLATVLVRQQRAASGALLQQLVTTNQAVIGAERDRTSAELDGRKSLIDQQLEAMATRLDQVSELVRLFEADRDQKFGQLSQQLTQQRQGLADLLHTTQSLREVLASPKSRGRWGERMAEDVLRLADFIENVNYRKQRAAVGGRGIPDFTFFLPNDLVVHMDVKFPLDNYVRYVESASDLERKRYRDDFLRDVRNKVRDLGTREYVDPAGGTVDFVLLFIPNEQLYTFIHEADDSIVQDASRQRVVLCSPLTLLAVLALIRQTCENFQLARRSDEILGLLGHFFEQWEKFVGQMDTLGKRIDSTSKEYEALVGTRKRMLEKRIAEINALRNDSRALAPVEDEDDEDGDGFGGAFALEA